MIQTWKEVSIPIISKYIEHKHLTVCSVDMVVDGRSGQNKCLAQRYLAHYNCKTYSQHLRMDARSMEVGVLIDRTVKLSGVWLCSTIRTVYVEHLAANATYRMTKMNSNFETSRAN